MLLKRIIASGLKGHTFDLELGAGTAIMGPNDAGKTAILDAIGFVCRGKFPEVKKGSWPEATVSGVFDDGRMVTRTINAKGTVATNATPGALEDLNLDVPLLDPEHYFGLTDSQRTNYVFERVKLPEGYTAESVIAEMERLSLGDEHSEDAEKAKGDLIGEIRGIFRDRSFTLQEALGVAVENLRTRYTYWNRRCKETQGAVTTLTELKLRQKNVVAAPAGLVHEIEWLTTDINSRSEKLGSLRQELLGIESAIATRKSLEKFLAEDRTDYDELLRRLKKEERLPIAEEFERVNESIIGIDLEEMERELAGVRRECKKASEAAAVFEDTRTAIAKQLEDLDKREACPYCASDEEGWKEKVRAKLKPKLKLAERTYNDQSATAKKLETQIADLEKRIAEFKATRHHAEVLRQKLKVVGDRIDQVVADKDRDTHLREERQKRLAEMPAPADPKKIEAEIETERNAQFKAQAEREELNAQKTAETRLQQDILRAGEAAKEHEIAAAQLLVTKKVAKMLDLKRENMVCEAFTKLLATANAVTSGILKSPLALHENTIGRFEGGEFIAHHWFGGTAKAITYIAIATALSANSPFKLVLLDEFGRLDVENQIKVITRLGELQADGVIDQFVLAGTTLPKSLQKGAPFLKVIEVKQ